VYAGAAHVLLLVYCIPDNTDTKMPKQISGKNHGTLIKATFSVALMLAAVGVLGTHWNTVRAGLDATRSARGDLLVYAIILMCVTFMIAAAIYGVLALHRLVYRQTLLIEVASGFVNRLLPSGIGGLGLHGLYLYRKHHSGAEATVVVSANNLIGMAAHLLLLALVILLRPDVVGDILEKYQVGFSWPIALAVLCAIVVATLIPQVRRKLLAFGSTLLQSVGKLRPSQIGKAVVLAVLLTLTYTAVLVMSARSIGISLNQLQIFIVFSLGMLFSTASPTPGGLVGAEAGLFAGFVAYGVSAPNATAAIILFRLVSYWLPLLPGAGALFVARQRRLV
jgi:uncharacterized membrane protein YbhN (UPF0104 family)